MRVGIDGFSLNRNDSGIEVYTRELIKGVAATNAVEVYSYQEIPLPDGQNVTLKHSGKQLGRFGKLKWEMYDLASLVSPDVDIFHSPHFTVPIKAMKAKKVVSLHDLAFLRHPEFFDRKSRLFFSLFLGQSLKKADAILCSSTATLDDVLEHYPSTRNKLHTVYLGYKDYSLIQPDNSILDELKIPSRFVLMIGTINPRKNIHKAVEAFQKATQGSDIQLVIVGELRKEYTFDFSDPRIRFTGYISETKLSALYRNAELLLFPSYYEGFGFPILEAMSVGLPVVTANVSSMPEVSGYPAEFLCDPGNVDNIAAIITRFLSPNPGFDFKGHARSNVKKFPWSRMISETLSVYEQLQKGV
jgi:glycosyltransferase involved in cell wall biosynthesis